MSDSSSLLHGVNNATYFLTSNFIKVNLNGASSYAWRIICGAMNGAQYRYEMENRRLKES